MEKLILYFNVAVRKYMVQIEFIFVLTSHTFWAIHDKRNVGL